MTLPPRDGMMVTTSDVGPGGESVTMTAEEWAARQAANGYQTETQAVPFQAASPMPAISNRLSASDRLAGVYDRSPGIASLVNPPRTNPGGEEDRQKMMDMQRETYRKFLAPPPGEIPPPTTNPVPPPIPPWTGNPWGGFSGGNYGFDPTAEIPPPTTNPVPPPTPPWTGSPWGGFSGGNYGFDPTALQEQIAANQPAIQDAPQFDPTQLREEMNTRFGNFSNFDPTALQEQIAANQPAIQDAPQFDPTQLREEMNTRFGNFSNFDPTALQERLEKLRGANEGRTIGQAVMNLGGLVDAFPLKYT